MDRRYFLMTSAGAAGSLRASQLASANNTVRVAVVGIRGQGGSHIGMYSRMPNVEIAALCDVDESVLNKRLDEVEKRSKKRPAAFTDIRKLLEDKSIDAVSIATPNHWHTLMTIWACQAGKDVYVEKPCSHNIFESRQIVAAAKKYNRVVAHGANSRSGPAIIEAMQKMKEGLIGEVYHARGLCYKWRDTIKRTPVEPVPAGVHYDLWLGPAPKREFTRNRFHYNWHWFWDYGNGDFGNQGIHELDICSWGIGVKYPVKVTAIGGHFMFDDDQETPNTLTVLYEFDGAGKRKMMSFETRHWITNHEGGIGGDKPGNTVGNIFYGSEGYLVIDGYTKYWTYLGREQKPGPARTEGGNNWANFIDVVRSRKLEDINAKIEDAAVSCTLMHLGNIAYRVGRTLRVDPNTGDILGDDEAKKLMTRAYRKPFVVPDKV